MTYQEKYPGQAKYAAKKKANGECFRCKNPRVPGMSVCPDCRVARSTDQRLRNQSRKNEQKCLQCGKPRRGDRAYCDRCSASKSGQAAGHGATLEDRERLYAQQEGKCGICEKSLESSVAKQVHVDHDHATNKIRGLLCNNCNCGIGNLRDSIELLERAVSYLKRSM